MLQVTKKWMVAGIVVAAAQSGNQGAISFALDATPAMQHGQAKPAQLAAQDTDPRIDRMWVREWENFAPFYVVFEDNYYCFPTFSPDRAGSNTTSVEDYIRQTAYEAEYKDEHGRARTLLITKPIEDAQAALWLLRDPKPGDYGYIHSGTIERINDGNDLVLRRVLLLDSEIVLEARHAEGRTLSDLTRDLASGRTRRQPPKLQGGRNRRGDARQRENALREIREMLNEGQDFHLADRMSALELHREEAFRELRWRIVGFNTEQLVTQERWPQGEAALSGLHLAIIAVDDDEITAIPAALLGRPLTEIQFLEVLFSRGYTKQTFVELVTQMRREHRRDYIQHVINRLEGLDDQDETPDDEEETQVEDKPINDNVELAD